MGEQVGYQSGGRKAAGGNGQGSEVSRAREPGRGNKEEEWKRSAGLVMHLDIDPALDCSVGKEGQQEGGVGSVAKKRKGDYRWKVSQQVCVVLGCRVP